MVNGIKSTLKSLKVLELSSPQKREWSIGNTFARRIPKADHCHGMATEEVKHTGVSIEPIKEVKDSKNNKNISTMSLNSNNQS
jgi:hypothetical protein